MEQQHPLPTEIRLHKHQAMLEVAFDDGARFRLPAEYLRVYSPSAEVRGHSPNEARLQVDKESVGIDDIRQVGAYAIKIVFDDGHDSGLYDWRTLYRLGRAWQPFWYDYLKRLADAGHSRKAADPFDAMIARGERPSELPEEAS